MKHFVCRVTFKYDSLAVVYILEQWFSNFLREVTHLI